MLDPPLAILFDLDGTLVDSLPDIAGAINGALEEHGLPTHSLAVVRTFVGHGIDHLVRRALGPAGPFETVLQTTMRRYRDSHSARTRPFPGIERLLDDLDAAGRRLAVVTNKPHDLAQEVVDTVFGPTRFEAVLGDRTGHPRKPDPTGALGVLGQLGVSAGAAWFVGDSPVDVETGRRAGMRTVAVSWGFSDARDLRASNPDRWADDVPALATALLPNVVDR